MEKQTGLGRARLALLCAAASLVLVLLCSQSSPLYPTNTWVDANCLLTVGRVMKEGGVLYRDIYEQKGPTLYLIHLLAAFISDMSFFGVFVMEVLSLAAVIGTGCRMLMRRMGTLSAFAAAALAAALIVSGGAFMKGDSAEEFCLPYLMGALHIAFMQYGERSAPMQRRALFACGLLAGVVATIKFTVLGLFVGLCLAEGVLALREGGLQRAACSAGVFLAGMLLPVAAWCAYFAANGALADFCTAYVHNNIFLYSDETRTAMSFLRDVLAAVRGNAPCAVVICLGLAALLRSQGERLALRFSVMSMAVCAFAAAFLFGRTFAYYPLALGVLAFPALMALYDLLPKAARQLSAPVMCVLALAAAVCLSPNAPLRFVKREDLAQTRLAAHIHPGATLLQYSHLDDGLYLASGTLPQERFFVRLNVNYDEMHEALDRYLDEGLPDYVLVSWEELPERFDRYQWVATDAGYDDANRINKLLHLYRRK